MTEPSGAIALWNHNTHYHSLVLNAAPEGAKTALDVGTGDRLVHRRGLRPGVGGERPLFGGQ